MFLPLHDKNPLRIIPFQLVTVSVILLCVVVFIYQQLLPVEQEQALILSFGMLPAVLFENRELATELAVLPATLTLLSSMFLHGGWMHLIGNMAFLWVFGDNVEDSMGHWRFLLFYCACGILAGVAHAVAGSQSINPLIGASGGVSGVLGAYLMLHPRVKVIVLVLMRLPLRLPAYWIIGGWIGIQLLNLLIGSGGHVAWWAHVGGFCTGLVLVPFFKLERVPLFDRGTPH
jgi:membrane associated rhomboid family serine protease